MQFLIDGHNLIPTLGMQLTSMDDELELMEVLQEFCRVQRARVEVYFDGAPAGTPSLRRMGAVTAHFVRIGSTADAAIEGRLTRLGKQARGWTVVSSDGRVQAAGRAVHAKILSSEEFARKVRTGSKTTGPKPEKELKPEEVKEWLDLFNKKK
jgi:predicted RNA-binding protein with PIN domain